MKTIALLILVIVPLSATPRATEPTSTPSPQQSSVREEKAMQVASAWANSLFSGETAVTTALSDVPFAMDRKQTIESIVKLEELFESVVASKGKRDIRVSEVTVLQASSEILHNVFPASYIVVQLMVEGEGLHLCVKPGDTFRVVGLSD